MLFSSKARLSKFVKIQAYMYMFMKIHVHILTNSKPQKIINISNKLVILHVILLSTFWDPLTRQQFLIEIPALIESAR